jgi:hypothetical protein
VVARNGVISAFVLVCVASVCARADMMSCPREVGGRNCASVCHRTAVQPTPRSNLLASPYLDSANLSLPSITLPIEPRTDAADIPETQPLRILVDRQNSLDLCLYGLVGLGLCRSGHWIKRPSLGFVPQWYSGSGPCHIGESLGVSLDTPCITAVCCLFQPECVAEYLIPRYRCGIIVSLWRESQFTPDVIASRAPPLCSC